ncbi:MAG: hypothetical protein COA82_06425 [Alkaliphilus sp.]|nr:SHOCT domain-containing protein [bacterium AH-315-L21]MBN4069277.1 SHOCT domain-containing protein [bacterium AH-315-G05]PHS34864.1 MAG: hypothetical protein COA82_06425 [Alkaliphilus sp.]
MMMLIWVLLGFGIYYLITNKGNLNVNLNGNRTAEETLKERFVNGEIDEETYKKMKATINR